MSRGLKKKLTTQEARQKINRYCAYQERCHQEVRHKLYDFGLFRDEVDQIITELITENFLNEERFAKAFAGGKFRLKNWGRIKIVNALEAKGVTKNCIKSGLKEIDENDYRDTLYKILNTKSGLIANDNIYVKRDKLAHYAISKGYEPDLVWQVLKQILPDHK
jgi:regulatory protein